MDIEQKKTLNQIKYVPAVKEAHMCILYLSILTRIKKEAWTEFLKIKYEGLTSD